MKRNVILLMAAASAANLSIAQAGGIGCFNGRVMDIRDYFMPAPGICGAFYSYDSFDEQLHDNGNGNSFVTFKTPFGVDLNLYTLVPSVIWISPYTIMGADYGTCLATFSADLFSGTRGNVRNSRFGSDDLYARAMWQDSPKERSVATLSHGFHAPAAFPDRAEASESKDNIGLGFSAQRARAGAAWYPMTNKATPVKLAWTYDYNPGHEYFDVRPGQMFTVSWIVSQYVPLRKNRELLLKAGPAGYDTCQITDSTGGDALADAPKSHVHALGGEVGLTYAPWNAFLKFRSFYEYAADSRGQGASIGLNFGIKF
jgi:hypothetical protein